MNSHIVHSYDEELEHITGLVVKMGLLVRDLVRVAEKSLKDHDTDYVLLAKSTDKKVNSLDSDIEKHATTIIALRQPMAIDLRLAISALKIAVMMERMGDLAKNTVKRASRMHIPPSPAVISNISQMADMIATMLEDTMVAFEERDLEKAHAIMMRDDEVDIIYRQMIADLQQDMIQNPSAIPSTMQVVFAVKNIERIGDYVSKIANIIHYIVSGERLTKALRNSKSPSATETE